MLFNLLGGNMRTQSQNGQLLTEKDNGNTFKISVNGHMKTDIRPIPYDEASFFLVEEKD